MTQRASIYDVQTRATGPVGALPLTAEMLRHEPSGNLFGWSQDVGMGLPPQSLGLPEFLLLSTQGGIRRPDGAPLALGYHTGHWEVGLLMETAARVLWQLRCIPYAAFCSGPCDGRTQGTAGMMDSLAYRNDAVSVFGRLIRSLPKRRGVIGIATCDKGLPAMMMALAEAGSLAGALIPGGVTLPAEDGEDAGKAQTIGARFAHGMLTVEEASEIGCRTCATPGGGCQFLGTAATAQVVAEALGITVCHAALAPSGQPIWHDTARRTAEAVVAMEKRGLRLCDVITPAAIRNAMVIHAAFGGSTNLLLHLTAIAFCAGLTRPSVDDWREVNRMTPRIVDALPNGPVGHPTVQVYLAGGVPEVMLALKDTGLLNLECLTVEGNTLRQRIERWERSERRACLKQRLLDADGVRADRVIMSPAAARQLGLTPTLCFPTGNLAPEGAVIKSTAIDSRALVNGNRYRITGRARVFVTERDAVAAIKATGAAEPIRPGDVVTLIGRGPMGCGMEEIYQVTSALRYLDWGWRVAVITDARFSGVSTGACIGHVSPEGLAGGPIGRLQDDDVIEIDLDLTSLDGRLNLVGANGVTHGADWGATQLALRDPHAAMAPDPDLPEATRLWAALQRASGGVWGGCVYDAEAIERRLRSTG
ncbi:MAG: YjhG/YagF family D-xylonate dehydratase [Armatimonadetes bacterium]|nr:YjhG/YagF family D-xylonate dehydratase [Armatimonadota bacterium]MDE2207522.1 YjhG/YagF family D-xylonate dehydratase [Armatimonadota bacterium]